MYYIIETEEEENFRRQSKKHYARLLKVEK